MKDERLYKQLRNFTNEELIYHAIRKDLYTDEVVEVANLILEERILTAEEIAYKEKVIINYKELQSKNNFSSESNLWLWISMLNNTLLIGFLAIIIYYGYFIIFYDEHIVLSLSILTLIANGLAFAIISFNKKKVWTLKFIMIFNIPISLMVGVQLLMLSFFGGPFLMALLTFVILAFIIINNNLIFNRKVQQSYKISNDFFTASMVINILFGLALMCYLYVSLVTMY